MTTPLLPKVDEKFDQSAQGQQQPAAHDPAAPRGETTISTPGKLLLGALVGAAAWFGWTVYGWRSQPKTKGKKR